MSRARWIPKRGEVVWLDFDPQAGHEQAGRRPALVVSEQAYNRIGLAIVCPITKQTKGYPFEVPVPEGKVSGVVLADQVKSVDWQVRNAALKASVPITVVDEVLEKLALILGMK